MKNLFLIIFTIATLTVAGQNHLIGVKGGVNFTNVSLTNVSIDTKNRVSFTRGLTYEYLLNRNFSLSAEILYDQRGYNFDMPLYDDFGNPTGETVITTEDFTYLSVPFKAGYNIGGRLYGYVNLGVIPARLLNCKVTIPIGSLNGETSYNNYSSYKKFDISALVELGVGYKINDRIRLISAFTFQHSLLPATSSEDGDNFELTHYGTSLTVGIKYTFMK